MQLHNEFYTLEVDSGPGASAFIGILTPKHVSRHVMFRIPPEDIDKVIRKLEEIRDGR